MSPIQRSVWWGPAPHKSSPAYRPWLLVSGSMHPFENEECIGLAMSTTRHSGSIPVPDTAWIEGGSEVDSYIPPWYTVTIKHDALDRKQGVLARETVERAVDSLHEYTTVE